MARKTAGARYPHASSTARQHDHRYCPVIGAIAARVGAGAEEWGTAHPLAVPPGTDPVTVRQGLFRGRDCAKLKSQHGALSVSVTYRADDGTESNRQVSSTLVVRVWSRDIAKQEIARRVKDGEGLHYNVMRGSV